jgi:hypothetical protein
MIETSSGQKRRHRDGAVILTPTALRPHGQTRSAIYATSDIDSEVKEKSSIFE